MGYNFTFHLSPLSHSCTISPAFPSLREKGQERGKEAGKEKCILIYLIQLVIYSWELEFHGR
jgi:hypothetical protein